jgi:hypothetical protein
MNSHMMRNAADGKKLRILRIVVLAVVVFLAMVWLRAFYGSMKAYEEGESYFKQDQWVQAITFFDRSIHWYTPYNPYVEKSAEKLWEIGERGQRDGDSKLALIAFRAIRGGFYSARSFYTPGQNWIRMSEQKIHELEEIETAQRGLEGKAKTGASIWEKSQEVPGPNPGWSVVVVFSFLGWIGSLFAFITCAFGPKGEGKRRLVPGSTWLGVAAIFYTLWIIGMFRA